MCIFQFWHRDVTIVCICLTINMFKSKDVTRTFTWVYFQNHLNDTSSYVYLWNLSILLQNTKYSLCKLDLKWDLFIGYSQHFTACPIILCRRFLPPKLKGLSICRGTKLRKKQQLYPQFQNSVGTLILTADVYTENML